MLLVAGGRINDQAAKDLEGYQSLLRLAASSAVGLTEAIRQGDKARALKEADEIQTATTAIFKDDLTGPGLAISVGESGFPRLYKCFLPFDLAGKQVNTIGTVLADFIDSLEANQPILKCNCCRNDFVASLSTAGAKFGGRQTKHAFCEVCKQRPDLTDYMRRDRAQYFRERRERVRKQGKGR